MPRWDDWDDGDEPSMAIEAVERRGTPRGVVRGLLLELANGLRVDAVEASNRGFFAQVADPERYRLGQVHEAVVSRGQVRFHCTVEVVRKEMLPRLGVALRIVRIAPDAQVALTALVAED